MLYQISWSIYPEHKVACNKIFARMNEEDDKKDAGDKIRMVGRWHVLGGGKGVCICETDDDKALASWMQNWQGMCEITVVPVIEDEDARSIIRSKLPNDENV
tara:strand:- start:2112 stop:2417 length:306 start_codon:yes stop_codon:yes gene_type:complete